MNSNRWRFGCLLMILVAVLALQTTALAQTPGRPLNVPGELLVKFKPSVTDQAIATLKAQIGLDTVKVFQRILVHHLRIRSGVPEGQVLARLRQLPEVEYAELNYLRYVNQTPNDPQYPQMWGLQNTGQTGGTPGADIHAPQAWEIQTGSPSMVVAVIDSGMDLTHEDLAANLWTNPSDGSHGWDFRDGDNNPTDTSPNCQGHGTHTAGTIGAAGNNEIGVVGVNWRVQLMPLRVFGGTLCSGADSNIIAAVDYYTSFGVRVSNNSYGGGPANQALSDAILASNSVYVAAAGNNGTNNDVSPSYPASYTLDNIVAVAATDKNDLLASFSNFGQTSVDLGAPGVDILSTLPGNSYGYLSGTSMATPHVAGAAALVLAQNPTLTNNEVIWRILKTADPTGLPVRTQGRLNLAKALQLQPDVTIAVTPQGPTTVHPGETVPYAVTLTNRSGAARTVTAVIMLRAPDGKERVLQGPMTVSLPVEGERAQTFSLGIPPAPLSSLFGANRLVGRVFTPVTLDSFAEAEVLYTLAPLAR
jgi:large repetitive protein